jgi:O-antigen/teichoic acid export membrane protein
LTSTQPRLKHALPAVYALAALRMGFPFVVLPAMALRLGADEFGRLSQILVWAALLSVLVEGGFGAAATRHAVAADAERRAALARQVFSARLLLSVAAALLGVAGALWAGLGTVDSVLLAALAVATGWPAAWYMQASGQLHRFARVEGMVHAVWLVLLLTLAHSAEAFLAINVVALGTIATLGWRWVSRDQTGSLWSPADGRAGLALGGAMLPVSLAGAAYVHALPAVAATQMPRAELGLYHLADRWVRALLMAAEPLLQIVYPRIVERFRHGARAALAYALRWGVAGALAGALLLGAGALAWPLLVARLPAGIDAAALAGVLAINAWLLPLLLGWKPVGLWMLGSARFDAAYRACMIVGGAAGIVAVLAWPVQGAVQLAAVALGVELLVIAVALVGIWGSLRWASTSTT